MTTRLGTRGETLRTPTTLMAALGLTVGLVGCSSAPQAQTRRPAYKPTPVSPMLPPTMVVPEAEPASSPKTYAANPTTNSRGTTNAAPGVMDLIHTGFDPKPTPHTSPLESPTANLHGLAVASSLESTTPTYGDAIDSEFYSQISHAYEGADLDPHVSPDGTRMVFASTRHGSNAEIYIKDVNSRVVTQLTFNDANDLMPSFSPDGRSIVFTSNRQGSWDIYTMPVEGGRALRVTSGDSHELHPSWSADGERIAYSRLGRSSGRWEIWISELHTPGVSRHIGFGLFPEWSPVSGTGEKGSDQILFQMARDRGDRAFSIWTLDYKEGKAWNFSEIASNADAALINPTWKRDGQWIVYSVVPNPDQWLSLHSRPRATALAMVHSSGMGNVTLTGTGTVNLLPVWGAGDTVYFVSDRGGVDNIWSLDAGNAIAAASQEINFDTAVTRRSVPNPTTASVPTGD